MVGRIVSSLYGKYKIFVNNQILTDAFTLRGNLNFKNDKVIAGDEVEFDLDKRIILKRLNRKSYLKRPEVANIDYLLIVSSLKEPQFSFDLIFKYLTYANFNNIKTMLIFTKVDMIDDEYIKQIKKIFANLSIPTFFVSNKNRQGIDELKDALNGHIFCLMGQSGVGKSSLINSIDKSFNRTIGQYSYALGRGKHQTKETILLPYGQGFLVDTPGFSSLDLKLNKIDLAHYFPGFGKHYINCEFSNCLHLSERNCQIKQLVNQGIIPKICYDYYMKLIQELENEKKR